MRDCVGFHDIEMFVGAEKPYIPGWHLRYRSLLGLRPEIRNKRGGQSSERVGVS